MDIQDSADITNRIKARTVLSAIAVHLFLALSTVGISLLLLAITGIITHIICQREIEASQASVNKFSKGLPFKYLGQPFGDFQHVFYHEENLAKDIFSTIEGELTTRTPIESLEPIKLTDVDKELSHPEDRVFIKADAGRTIRGTTLTLVLQQANYGAMQSIRWWVLAGGFVDKDKRFNFIAYSFLTLPFWIVPYIRKNFDVLSHIRTIYTATYNDIDVMTQIRCLHEAVFNAMVNELEKHDIDTSDIKAQRMQVMNINISGGKVNMGNVVQGAMNKVAASMKKAAA